MDDKNFKQVSRLMHAALIEGGVPNVHDLIEAFRGNRLLAGTEGESAFRSKTKTDR